MVVGFNKNIVENGIKYHSTNPKKYTHVSKMWNWQQIIEIKGKDLIFCKQGYFHMCISFLIA
jgi:hypothetical protein